MKNDICKCPYIPCEMHGNCTACIAKNVKDGELANCMEEIAVGLGAKLPLKFPKTVICRDYVDMSKRCAELVREQLAHKPDSLLCFPAGSTVTGTCAELEKMKSEGKIDFSKAKFVALDEWVGLEDDSEDCTHFLTKHLYGALGIRPDQMTLFNPHAEDLDAECKRIDNHIFSCGCIDLMLLGLGMNGHLGLNEPGGGFADYAKVVSLSDTTINVGQKYFSKGMKLTRGITLGIHHMFDAKKVILQVSGDAKKDIVYEMYTMQPTTNLPGTILKLLKGGLVVLDEAAAQRVILNTNKNEEWSTALIYDWNGSERVWD